MELAGKPRDERKNRSVYAAMPQQVNILMVDDQPAKLLTYEVMLAELGENLLKATSAREALEILLKNDVAVVLMDVSMPDIASPLPADCNHLHLSRAPHRP